MASKTLSHDILDDCCPQSVWQTPTVLQESPGQADRACMPLFGSFLVTGLSHSPVHEWSQERAIVEELETFIQVSCFGGWSSQISRQCAFGIPTMRPLSSGFIA